MITFLIRRVLGLFASPQLKRDAYNSGFDRMAAAINSLRTNHDEYDPSIPFTARARVIAMHRGNGKYFGEYQDGIRDATVVYEREFGAP